MAGLQLRSPRLEPIAAIPKVGRRPIGRWQRIRYELEEPYRSLVTAVAFLRVGFAVLAGLLGLVVFGGFVRVGVASVYELVVALMFASAMVLFGLAAWRFNTPLGWWAGLAACTLTALVLLGFAAWAPPLCALDGLTKCVPRGAAESLRMASLPFLAGAGLLLLRRPGAARPTDYSTSESAPGQDVPSLRIGRSG